MIGVAQDKRGVDVPEMFGREGLDRCLRAYGCKDRGDQITMRRCENSRTGAIVFGCDSEVKHWADYNLSPGQRMEYKGIELLHKIFYEKGHEYDFN